ncbi:MAG: IS200/IS605 family transposase [Balneolaceae bacterium]
MSTYTQLLYQIVFSTKHRKSCMLKDKRDQLYKYIWGVLKNKNCHLYRINGVEDHLHILIHIPPSISISSVVKDVKVSSSMFIKEHKLFQGFDGWQEGYGAFTYSINEKDRLIEYIKNQEEHHKKVTFKEEYRSFLIEHGIKFEEKYILG